MFVFRDQQGLEFDLVPSMCKDEGEEAKIFVIEKRLRKSRTETQTISYYYLIDGFCSQAPIMKNVIDVKTSNIAFYIQKQLDYVTKIKLAKSSSL